MYRYTTVVLLMSCPLLYAEGQEDRRAVPVHPNRSEHRNAQRRQGTLHDHEEKLAAAEALPINVALEVLQESIIPGENLPVRFTIHNPHPFAIYFPHVGYEYPHLYAAVGEEELWFVGRAGGVNPGAVISPMLEPGESATAELLIFLRLTGLNRFEPKGGYTLRLRAGGAMRGYRIEGDTHERVTFQCVQDDEVQIPVRVRTAREEEAFEALTTWKGRTFPGLIRDDLSHDQMRRARIEFYASLLERFGDTPYAKEVRVVLGLVLREHIEYHRKEKDVVDEYEPLLVQCIMDCLKQGPAYAPVVHSWNLLEHFGMRSQWNDMINVMEALLKFPEQDRTVDSVLTRIGYYAVPIEILQKHGLPEGALSERLETVLVHAVERCLSWEGYRAVASGEDTYALLSGLRRWDLVQRAADRTLAAAERPKALTVVAGGRYAVREEDVLAARNALERVRAAREDSKRAGEPRP